MKRFLFTALIMLLGALSMNAQSVNGVPFSDIDVEYEKMV